MSTEFIVIAIVVIVVAVAAFVVFRIFFAGQKRADEKLDQDRADDDRYGHIEFDHREDGDDYRHERGDVHRGSIR